MELEKLNLIEFFKDEYSKVNKGFGIGGSGIITPKQMINVININDENKKELNGWGQGSHQMTFEEILKKSYNLQKAQISSNFFKLSKLLERIIYIHYINWTFTFQKYVQVNIPAYITNSQYESLLKLNKSLEEISCYYNIKIFVQIDGYIFEPKAKEIFRKKTFESNNRNNLLEALVYLKKENRINEDKSKEIYSVLLLSKEKQLIFKETNKQNSF